MRMRRAAGLGALVCLGFAPWIAAGGEPACGLEGISLYVDDDAPPGGDGLTWETAFNDVKVALIAIAGMGDGVDRVLIAQGTYVPFGRAGFGIQTGLDVFGGFAGLGAPDPCARDPRLYETILSGDLNGDDEPGFVNYTDNAGPVVTLFGTNTLDGVTITSGYNPEGAGGGLLGGVSAKVIDCTIRASLAGRGGGARGPATLIGCEITGNRALDLGGGFAGPGTLNRCTIARNEAAGGGGIESFAGSIMCINSLITGNSTYSTEGWNVGGAAALNQGTLVNCTIVGNSAPHGDHGGILTNDANFYNCIIWDNRDRSGATLESNISTLFLDDDLLRHSCVQGWPPDFAGSFSAFQIEGTIGDDPLLQDAGGPDNTHGTPDDNPRPGAFSPCIDAGLLESAFVVAVGGQDLDGLTRQFEVPSGDDRGIDIGAFEYQDDCDGNGVLDFTDLTDGGAPDCDGNGQPDSCQPQTDCNRNGIADFCDIAAGAAADCNGNGIPDACDIARGASIDSNANGAPDECEPLMLFVDQAARGGADGSTWADAFTDLQDALDTAHSRPGRTEVWVARGDYLPDRATGEQDRSFIIGGSLAVYGGFAGGEVMLDQRDPAANPTILNGDLAANDIPGDEGSRADNVFHVIQATTSPDRATLDGFIITGGGTYSNDEPVIYYTNCFGGCAPDHWGGGIRVFGRGLVFRDCLIERNTAFHWAAGAYIGPDASVTFERCTFRDPEPAADTGGILNNRGAVELLGCSFIENHCTVGFAGAIFNSGTLRATDTSFIDNSTGGSGGAVTSTGDADFIRCDFIGSASNSASAINAPGVLDSSFFVPPGQTKHDGATRISACRFIGNNAIHTIRDFRFRIRVADSLFIGNSGGSRTIQLASAGNVPIDEREAHVDSCTFVGNTHTHSVLAIPLSPAADSSINNCIFSGNTTPGGDPLPVNAGNDIAPSFCLIEAPAEFDGRHGTFIAKPTFVDPLGPDGIPTTGDEDYTLALGSPGLDAGSNLLLPADTLDLDADGDTIEPLPLDLAGRPRIADAPRTPDIGEGEPPVVDMGAFETIPPGLTCPGDIDGNAFIGAADLNIILADFGCTGADCQGDIDADGDIDTFDLNLILATFGTACP